ncbi:MULTISPECIES: glycosyltransferase [unclassified Desulfovibrio]|uniref:glycosyltransferase n=1 Tax=unclassified Desulfovibrio TaxID=2593640 RepID=UPI001E430DB9|nr:MULTISPECIES: glycosyltransferase [unclassified Desulfovibrio]
MDNLDMRCIYIITPSFNAVETIEETLYSVFSQRGEYVIHYHVQDGTSCDGTQNKLEKFARDISTIDLNGSFIFSWCSQPDKGMYHAISLAVAHLNIPEEAFMGWINADDLLYAGCIANLFKVVKVLPQVQWVGGKPMMIDMAGNIIPRKSFDWYGQQLIRNGLCDGVHWPYIQQEGTFWRKWLWDAAGGINSDLRLAGDWDLWRRMAEHSPYIQLPWHMGVFRKRYGQLSSNISAYNEEINSLSPIVSRYKYLRNVSIETSTFFAPTVVSIGENHFQLVEVPLSLRLGCKMRIRLFLLSLGLHSFVAVCQKILRALKGGKG